MHQKNVGGAPLAPASSNTTPKVSPPNFHTDDGRHVHLPSGPPVPMRYDPPQSAMQHA